MTYPRRRTTDGSRILVVEDNDDLRQLMVMALEGEGYRVDQVASAEAGLSLMLERRGVYDLVLTDYTLPGRTGAWLLREAVTRRLLHGAATLLVTADPDGPEIGADQEVVPKPVNFDEFLPQIRAILAAGRDDVPARPGDGAPVMPDPVVELVLYVSPDSVPSVRATRAMRHLLERYDSRAVRFLMSDTTRDPAAAAADRIIFTPTLVKRSPPPSVWILGDLSRLEVVIDLLQMCGVTPAAPSQR